MLTIFLFSHVPKRTAPTADAVTCCTPGLTLTVPAGDHQEEHVRDAAITVTPACSSAPRYRVGRSSDEPDASPSSGRGFAVTVARNSLSATKMTVAPASDQQAAESQVAV